jgi:F-type H+-transporting ATPase subunit delta
MINLTKFARPYATAAFEYAQQQQQLNQWEKFLQILAALCKQPAIIQLLKSPLYTSHQHAEVFIALVQHEANPAQNNFIKILAQNRRLNVLPNIAELFTQLREAAEKTLAVQIKSATPLQEAYKHQLETLLSTKYSRKITSEYKVDPQLIGGLVIYIGDQVIDGSVRDRLERLREVLVN